MSEITIWIIVLITSVLEYKKSGKNVYQPMAKKDLRIYVLREVLLEDYNKRSYHVLLPFLLFQDNLRYVQISKNEISDR